MDKKEIQQRIIKERIIKEFQLNDDFFTRNPIASVRTLDKWIDIEFKNYELILTRKEYEALERYLHWGCAACCGMGDHELREEGNYIKLIGYSCMCHPTHWWWSLYLRS